MKTDLIYELLYGEYKLKELGLEEVTDLIKKDNNIKSYLFITDNTNNKKQIIERILLKLGIPSNLKGYIYITEAIFLCLENKEYESNITNKLYPKVAQILNVKEYQVEKNIRKAIEVSWTNANPELLEELFGYSIGYTRDRPTNSNYIITISNILK